MAKPEWGVKRFCGGCGARFYDLGRDPIICPKCGVAHDPVVQARPQRAKTAALAATKAKAKPAPVEAVAADGTEAADGAEAAGGAEADGDNLLVEAAGEAGEAGETEETEEEEEEAIEDASELGEDKDDILEVIENVEGDKEPEG